MEDQTCPKNNLEACICILKSPGVFNELNREPGSDDNFQEYSIRQRTASALYRLSSFNPDDGEKLKKRGYDKKMIVDSIRDEMLSSLTAHVCECPFCLDRYQEFLKKYVKEMIFCGKYPSICNVDAQDDFESPEFIRLKIKADALFLRIYDF